LKRAALFSIKLLCTSNNMFRVYHNAACVKHDIPGHPERPERVKAMLLQLLKNFPASDFKESGECSDEHILLFHTPRHMDVLKDKCRRAEETRRMVCIDDDTAVMSATR
jgi:acetoin utilization deacetylase AcuC-like enzyme